MLNNRNDLEIICQMTCGATGNYTANMVLKASLQEFSIDVSVIKNSGWYLLKTLTTPTVIIY